MEPGGQAANGHFARPRWAAVVRATRWLAIAVAVAVALVPGGVGAQAPPRTCPEPDGERAELLRDLARVRQDAAGGAEAGSVHRRFSRIYEGLGRIGESSAHFERYLRVLESRGEEPSPEDRAVRDIIEQLREHSVPLTVVTEPEGARVVLDGDVPASRPGGATWYVLPGRWCVEVGAPCHVPHRQEVTVDPGSAGLTARIVLEPAVGFLSLESDPPGAAVRADGVALGETPLARHELCPGAHELVLALEGFEEERLRPEILAGRETHERRTLRPSRGTLSVESMPSGARVVVQREGRRHDGQTPLRDLALPPGRYEVTVALAGYLDSVTRVEIRPGEARAVHARLEERSWWTWRRIAGVGSLALGTVALATGVGLGVDGVRSADTAASCLTPPYSFAGYRACAPRYNDAMDRVVASYWLYGASAVLVTAGLVLLLLPEDEPASAPPEAPAFRVRPGVGHFVSEWSV